MTNYLIASRSPWSPRPYIGRNDLQLLMLLPPPSEWEIIGVYHHTQFMNTRYQTRYFVYLRQACYSHKNIANVLVHFSGAQFLLLSYTCLWTDCFQLLPASAARSD